MGSRAKEPQEDLNPLPPATDPSLVLTQPTEAEKRQIWTLNHGEWGGALTLQEYHDREPYLATIPLAARGGMAHWILTTTTETEEKEAAESRPVLASCESLRKRVLYVPAAGSSGGEEVRDGDVREGVGYGVASVYTYPERRGRQYAGRMLSELGPALRTWPRHQARLQDPNGSSTGEQKAQPDGKGAEGQEEEAICSALWSDIGKQFYAKKGWAAFPSVHAEFSASTVGEEEEGTTQVTTPITYDTLPTLCADDERVIRRQLVDTAHATGRTAMAFAPDHDALRWHLFRDDFIAALVYPDRGPSDVRGAVAVISGDGEEGGRVWAIWTRNYHSKTPAETRDKNTLYILRLVIESPASSPISTTTTTTDQDPNPALLSAFESVLQKARHEARRWDCGKIDVWNPTPAVRQLIERSGLAHRWVDRDTASVPSLMWYGGPEATSSGEVEWVASEKYCWC
ncbi:Uu.00g048970.m01.CDS01 [Anthostomella pinea]|uniref:Uu.00g048970.m01.CDS01 n=1 Tax=Anthostomella pinea TaxID=933095 RepID=A0AAI8VBQ4_9PEZI|nr:Uu.00g048970.m01.CDS01 [Anthostomella pinea]